MEAVGEGRPCPVAVDGRADIHALGLLLRDALGTPARRPRRRERRGWRTWSASAWRPTPATATPTPPPWPRTCAASSTTCPCGGSATGAACESWRKWRRRHPGSLAWLLAGASALLATALALGGLAVAYSQRLGQVEAALQDGRADRQAGRPEEAARTLAGGIDAASVLPGMDRWRGALRRELRLAERDRMARELHELADLVRFRYGVDPPSDEEARSLGRLCRAILGRPDLFDLAAQGEAGGNGRVATDLREVAAVWADTLERRAAPGAEDGTLRETRRLLARADALARARGREAPGASPTAWELYDKGRASLRAGDDAGAEGHFARGLEIRPQDFWPNFHQGLCLYRLGRFGEAAAAFRVCVALQPDSAECRHNRALALAALGDVEAATREYDRALEADPELAAAALNRGILSYQAGRLDDAEADFRRAIRSAKDEATRAKARDNLALIERAGTDLKAADARHDPPRKP